MSTKVILYINKSDSRCGACGMGADPYEETHETLLGLAARNDNMKGCGARYTHVSSDYIGLLDDIVPQIRPDLIYTSPWDTINGIGRKPEDWEMEAIIENGEEE